MRLNLGCGNDVKQGYVNVDFRQTHPAVMKVDLSALPWPFESESADEILMLDFLEHFPYSRTNEILAECWRILKPGGIVKIQVPDFWHVAKAILGEPPFMCNKCGHRFECGWGSMNLMSIDEQDGCPKCKSSYGQIADAGVARLFGGQDYEGNWHQTTFDKRRLERLAADAKLTFVAWIDGKHQYANWNICGEFVKR